MMKKANNLTKEEKLELISALEEKEKRIKATRSLYKPNSLQDRVHKSLKRIRLVTSANAAGKTCLATWEAYWSATGINPYRKEKFPVPNKGIVVLDSPDKTQRWIDEFNRWHNTETWTFLKHGKPYINEIVLPNGSQFVFMYHQQEPGVWESFEADWCVMDEPCPRPVFVGVQRSLRRNEGAWTLIVGTPLAHPWLKQDLYDPAMNGTRTDIEVFKAGILVNAANLGSEYIENFSKDLTEHEKRVRLHGDFSHLEGLALMDLFDRNTHVVPRFNWPRHNPCILAVDPHPSKPHTAILLGTDKWDRLYVLKTLKLKAAPKDFGAALNKFVEGFNVIEEVCDSLGATPSSGGEGMLSFIDVVNKQGRRLRSTTFKEKGEDIWVQNLRQLLTLRETNFGKKMPGLYIFEDLLEIINEFESVMWKRNRADEMLKGHLDIGNKDLLACLKYAIASPPIYNRITTAYNRAKPSAYGVRKSK